MKTIKVDLPEELAGDRAGEYELRQLAGGERWDLDEECVEMNLDPGSGILVPRQDFKKWSFRLLSTCLVKPALSEEDLKLFPGPALDLLLEKATELNYLSREARRFLQSGSSSKSPPEKR